MNIKKFIWETILNQDVENQDVDLAPHPEDLNEVTTITLLNEDWKTIVEVLRYPDHLGNVHENNIRLARQIEQMLPAVYKRSEETGLRFDP